MKVWEENDFEFLLHGKPFNKLLAAEKERVLKVMTEEEYAQHLLFLKISGEALVKDSETLSIKDSVHENISTALKRKHHKTFTFPVSPGFIRLPAQAYKTGLAILSVCCFIFLLINYLNSQNEASALRKMADAEEKIIPEKGIEKKAAVEVVEEVIITDPSGVESTAGNISVAIKKVYPVNDSIEYAESLAYDVISPEDLKAGMFNSSNMNPPGMTERLLMLNYN